jgi:hypothetical protein
VAGPVAVGRVPPLAGRLRPTHQAYVLPLRGPACGVQQEGVCLAKRGRLHNGDAVDEVRREDETVPLVEGKPAALRHEASIVRPFRPALQQKHSTFAPLQQGDLAFESAVRQRVQQVVQGLALDCEHMRAGKDEVRTVAFGYGRRAAKGAQCLGLRRTDEHHDSLRHPARCIKYCSGKFTSSWSVKGCLPRSL